MLHDIDEGTYVLLITSMTSTNEKFVLDGLGKNSLNKDSTKVLRNSCLKVQYSYYITADTDQVTS